MTPDTFSNRGASCLDFSHSGKKIDPKEEQIWFLFKVDHASA